MRDFDTLFSDWKWPELGAELEKTEARWSFKVDILETDKSYLVEADLPGMDPKDVKIDLDGNRLTISGAREVKKEENGLKYHRLERGYGSFFRSFVLPETADLNSIEAEFKNGVLKVKIDKSVKELPRKIQIKTNS